MRIEREKAKAMFHAAGWDSAPDWDDTRLLEKIEKINLLNVEVPEDADQAKLFKRISKAIEAEEDIELVDKAPKEPAKVEQHKPKKNAVPAAEEKAANDEADVQEVKAKKAGKVKAEKAPDPGPEPAASEPDAEVQQEEGRPAVGWRLVKAQTVPATPKLAKEFSEMEATLVERPFKERKVERLRAFLENGEYRPPTFARALCKENGVTYRVDAQHNSAMLADAAAEDKALLDGVFVHLEDYEADTLADVALLWGTFDSKEQVRSNTDIVHAVSQTIDKVQNLDAKVVNLAVGAINYAMGPTNQGGGRHQTALDRANVLYDNENFVKWLANIVGERKDENTAFMWRVPVVAAMFATWEKSPREAKAFWVEVREGTNTDTNSPSRKFQKWLMLQPTSGGRSADPQKAKVVPKEFYSRAVLAWSAHKTGEPMKAYKSTDGFPEVA